MRCPGPLDQLMALNLWEWAPARNDAGVGDITQAVCHRHLSPSIFDSSNAPVTAGHSPPSLKTVSETATFFDEGLPMPQGENRAYSAYGYAASTSLSKTLSGFNGEFYLAVLGSYLLGNGYRSYSPGLMRFQSPDDWSPFGQGGLNSYAFCAGDPVNNQDPSGHMKSPVLRVSPSTLTIAALREPDIFANIIKHSRLADAAALARTSKHLKQMTQPAMTKIARSREQPERLLASAQEGTVGPALGHSYEVLVKSPSIDLTPFKGKSQERDQLIRNIEADRQFRAAQRDRSPSFDSSSASDSEDEIARINEGIRKALRGPQL